MNKEEEKELIEKICAYAQGLIRRCEYTDNPRQVTDFAKKELGAFITLTELDRLVRKHMRMPNQTQRGSDAEPVPYKDFQDYVDRIRVNIRVEQHGENHEGEIRLSDMLSGGRRISTYQRKK